MANKHCRKFNNHEDYISALTDGELIKHNISYCKEEKDFHYDNDIFQLECIYNVTNTNLNTNILSSMGVQYITAMEIDDVLQPNVITSYRFNTIGNHIVKFSINNLTINSYMFNNINSLINFKINEFIHTINPNAFSATGIYSINLPKTVTNIVQLYSSMDCFNLNQITVDEDNPIYDSRNNCNAIIHTSTNKLIIGCKNTIIPDTVTIIGTSALSYSDSLPNDFYVSTINIPNSVEDILSYGLNIPMLSLNLPESVIRLSSIDTYSNADLLRHSNNPSFTVSKLTSITVDEDNPVFDSRNNCNAIIHTSSNTLLYGCKNTIIPDTVTTINSSAFRNITDLTSITIPASVTYIGIRNGLAPFNQCTGLETVIFLGETPPTVTGGNNGKLFSYYTHPNLTNIYVPDESVLLYRTTFSNANVIDPDYIELIVPMSTMP